MASLGALKRSMALTLILIFGLLFVLLIVVSTLLQWYMGDIGFPFRPRLAPIAQSGYRSLS